MQIVTDTGMDLNLTPDEMPDMEIHVVPHVITLEGKTYRSGIDITAEELYDRLAASNNFPETSQPSAGEFADQFRQLASTDPDILAITMSSGLSGTYNAARLGAEMAPQANVTVVDSKTLSGVMGWQVAGAARAIKLGWSKDRIADLVRRIVAVSDSIYTLDDLKYLIHGGRISHMKGLLASMLKIRPIIGVAKDNGAYEQLAMMRTFERALDGIVEIVLKKHPAGTPLRTQVVHAGNLHGAEQLREKMDRFFKCAWQPISSISPVLGAHTGPSMVGVGFAALAEYPQIS